MQLKLLASDTSAQEQFISWQNSNHHNHLLYLGQLTQHSTRQLLQLYSHPAPRSEVLPQCGQKAEVHRLSFHEIGHDAVHYFTHADKSIVRLLKELAKKPDYTTAGL